MGEFKYKQDGFDRTDIQRQAGENKKLPNSVKERNCRSDSFLERIGGSFKNKEQRGVFDGDPTDWHLRKFRTEDRSDCQLYEIIQIRELSANASRSEQFGEGGPSQ